MSVQILAGLIAPELHFKGLTGCLPSPHDVMENSKRA